MCLVLGLRVGVFGAGGIQSSVEVGWDEKNNTTASVSMDCLLVCILFLD